MHWSSGNRQSDETPTLNGIKTSPLFLCYTPNAT
uniref:Uncharacterized protein n=1 Tax=Siphoviridae sp. ctoRD1 TaxID=2825669 RepID=A0A8S5QE19_9CAUD|nr:MAG TPA: hypothetical protein [Siphoviridae sp. ctoRD1]